MTQSNPNLDLWILPLTGDRKPYRLTQSRFNESFGRFSPDGRWIAYMSDESGRPEIYIDGQRNLPVTTKSGRFLQTAARIPNGEVTDENCPIPDWIRNSLP